MGSSKAGLDWHGSTLLRRVTGILVRSVAPGPVVVVSAPGQKLPAVAADVEVVADERAGRGPLQGLATGLDAIRARADVAYVSAVDMPLLHPAFVRAVLAAVGEEVDVAVPALGGHHHPLAAAYRVSVRGVVEELLSTDRLALAELFDRCRLRRLADADLPAPESLTNLNDPGDYQRALALPAPSISVDGSATAAWRLGDVLRGERAVSINGEPVQPDPELPLVAGDVVVFS